MRRYSGCGTSILDPFETRQFSASTKWLLILLAKSKAEHAHRARLDRGRVRKPIDYGPCAFSKRLPSACPTMALRGCGFARYTARAPAFLLASLPLRLDQPSLVRELRRASLGRQWRPSNVRQRSQRDRKPDIRLLWARAVCHGCSACAALRARLGNEGGGPRGLSHTQSRPCAACQPMFREPRRRRCRHSCSLDVTLPAHQYLYTECHDRVLRLSVPVFRSRASDGRPARHRRPGPVDEVDSWLGVGVDWRAVAPADGVPRGNLFGDSRNHLRRAAAKGARAPCPAPRTRVGGPVRCWTPRNSVGLVCSVLRLCSSDSA